MKRYTMNRMRRTYYGTDETNQKFHAVGLNQYQHIPGYEARQNIYQANLQFMIIIKFLSE